MKISRSRLILLGAVTFYFFVFNYAYEHVISPDWDYFGLGFSPPPFWMEVFSFLYVFIPITWTPITFNRPSLILFYTQYIFVYIPSLVVCYHVSIPDLSDYDCFTICTFLFVGIVILSTTYLLPSYNFKNKVPLRQTYNLTYVGLIFCIFLVLVIGLHSGASLSIAFSSGNDSQIVGQAMFEAANETRGNFAASAESFGGRLIRYSLFWLCGFFLPLAFAFGVFFRKKRNFLVFAIGYLIVFVCAGYKSCLIALVAMPGLWFILGMKRNGPAVMFCLCAILMLASCILKLTEINQTKVGAIVSMPLVWAQLRIFCIAPLALVQYYDFFSSNPLTYMSHVTGFNLLIDYPYEMDLGKLVGRYQYDGAINVNAGLWASDGIAAFGLFGIITSSLICSLVFWILDCVSKSFNPSFVALTLGYFAMTFTNTSFFTNILTGGLFLLILTLYFMPSSTKIKTWLY